MYTPSIPTQEEIDAIVKATKAELPVVQSIRWECAQDWSGDGALFFRIVLSDVVVRGRNSYKATEQVRRNLIEKIKPQERGLIAYFNFRGQAEQRARQEEAWM